MSRSQKYIYLITGLILLLVGIFLRALTLGEIDITLPQVFQILTGQSALEKDIIFALENIRLPRTLLAVLVGFALAIAGVICQGVLRNPLAEPSIIGIHGGAAVAAMFIIVQYENAPPNILPWAAFGGALTVSTVIYLLSYRGGIAPNRLILIGIGINSLGAAISGFISSFGDIDSLQRAMMWMSGSMYDSTWLKITILASWLIIPTMLAWVLSRELDLLAFKEETGRVLGQPVFVMRSLMILLCAVISGAAVASVGLIGFVGLVAPHIARALVGTRHALLFPACGLIGSILVLSADQLGQHIIAPEQLPAGILTIILGAPFFIYLIWRQSRV